MEHFLQFYFMRLLILGGIGLVVIVGIFVAAVILKKKGRLGQAKDVVEPLLRRRLERTGGTKGRLASLALDRLSETTQQHRDQPPRD